MFSSYHNLASARAGYGVPWPEGPRSLQCASQISSVSLHGDKPSTPIDLILSSGSRLTKEHCVLKAPGLRKLVLVKES
jgi:hypothetical protein